MEIAIVTGASSGLGREYAKLLDQEGLDEIWLVARRRPQLETLAGELTTKKPYLRPGPDGQGFFADAAASLSGLPGHGPLFDPRRRLWQDGACGGRSGRRPGKHDRPQRPGRCQPGPGCTALLSCRQSSGPDLFLRSLPAHSGTGCLRGDESLSPALQPGTGRGTGTAGYPRICRLSVLGERYRIHRDGQPDR